MVASTCPKWQLIVVGIAGDSRYGSTVLLSLVSNSRGYIPRIGRPLLLCCQRHRRQCPALGAARRPGNHPPKNRWPSLIAKRSIGNGDAPPMSSSNYARKPGGASAPCTPWPVIGSHPTCARLRIFSCRRAFETPKRPVVPLAGFGARRSKSFQHRGHHLLIRARKTN